jgi:hypothetical protein
MLAAHKFTKTEGPLFNAEWRSDRRKSIASNQSENTRECDAPRISNVRATIFISATFINALRAQEFPHRANGTDRVCARFSAATTWS